MFNNPTTQSPNQGSIFPPLCCNVNLPIGPKPLLFAFFLLLSMSLFTGCASIYRPVLKEPLSHHDATTVISKIRDQEDKVSSFYTFGSLLVKGWEWDTGAGILIAGIRDPLKIKIEITHPWGKPMLHILIDDTRLEVLSFGENRLYLGDFTSETLSRFIPGFFFDHNMIWAVLRGYPYIKKHHRFESTAANRISLFDKKEREIEIIDLHPESLLPRRVTFPEQYLDLVFSGLKEGNGIYHAEEVIVNSMKERKGLIFKSRKMVFNRTIPDQIFILEKLPTFETIYLDEVRDDRFK
ncbi:hypothetical protein ACFL7M_10575 [Thermodesulfobacteriota bacterium]